MTTPRRNKNLPPRARNTKIVATLGPASGTKAEIEALFHAGADVFRLNFSHGTRADHQARIRIIREIEQAAEWPIGVVADLQGPKLRIGKFAGGKVDREPGKPFRLDLDSTEGDARRVQLPHRELIDSIGPGSEVLLDDGRVRLQVKKRGPDYLDTVILSGRALSDRKGVNVPGVVLPLAALTEKDRGDLAAALDLGADWIALSFVQRPDDVAEARRHRQAQHRQ